jgi:hypothetical protein
VGVNRKQRRLRDALRDGGLVEAQVRAVGLPMRASIGASVVF